jgi:OmpA-OmpF porin, OOP family
MTYPWGSDTGGAVLSGALGLAVAVLLLASPGRANAQEDAEGSASISASTSEGVVVDGDGARPSSNYIELGIFGGVMFPSRRHNLHDAETDAFLKPHRAFQRPSLDVGARLGYYPLSFVGLEAEGAYIPSKTPTDDGSAYLWAARGHLVGQVPIGIVTPFVLGGFGRLGADSDSMGSDSDPAVHFGGGVKLALGSVFGVRLDARDTLTQRRNSAEGTQAHHPEILLGLSVTLGLSSKKAPAAVAVAPTDSDGDGIEDTRDKCPTVAGVEPDGCPVKDTDGDGIEDTRDKCPTVAGVEPDGCPVKDRDGDGIPDHLDKCPDEPETKNGFEDEDGCPDEVPEQVKQFTGVIKGIQFDFGKATIRPDSKPTLDAAVKVLKENPSVRIEISGHTDNVGPRPRNVQLSKERAEAVKEYIVSKGIDASRLETRGAGPDEPIENNATAAGRQKNRRTEFKLLEQ